MTKEQKTAIQPTILQKGEGKTVNVLGDIITIKIAGEQTEFKQIKCIQSN
jgi:hypothetical protein